MKMVEDGILMLIKLVMADDELDEVELTQDFGELDEDHTKRENDQLKKIAKELKGSV